MVNAALGQLAQPLLLQPLHSRHPRRKMAIGGFFNSLRGGSDKDPVDTELRNEYDAEKSNGHGETGRRMSRIDRPIVKPIVVGGEGDDVTAAQLSVDRQMELEEGNAIKYRTCGWFKVIRRFSLQWSCYPFVFCDYRMRIAKMLLVEKFDRNPWIILDSS